MQKLLEQQQYRCGGCGIKVTKVYTRRMRYCDYYGRLFCQRCHRGAKMRIPARVIYQWNFKSVTSFGSLALFLIAKVELLYPDREGRNAE